MLKGGAVDITVALRRRPAARRMTLRVSGATGEVVLTCPSRTPLAAARAFLDSQAAWVQARLGRLPPGIPFAIGAVVPVRDVPHRIVRVPGRGATRPAEGLAGFEIQVGGAEEALPGRVRRWLVETAAADLGVAVARHAAALKLSRAEAPARIALRDPRSRWGSCSSSRTLSFSWRLVMAPPSVLDYLAAHEVAHLREMNHSDRFWGLVHDLCPGTDEAEAWLKRHGAGLHRYG